MSQQLALDVAEDFIRSQSTTKNALRDYVYRYILHMWDLFPSKKTTTFQVSFSLLDLRRGVWSIRSFLNMNKTPVLENREGIVRAMNDLIEKDLEPRGFKAWMMHQNGEPVYYLEKKCVVKAEARVCQE